MIAYLEKYDTTVEVPDNIGEKELSDVNDNFHSYVDKPTAPDQTTPEPGTQPAPGSATPAEPPVQKWQPNFYEGTLKPAISNLLTPVSKLAEATESPEAQAFTGKTLEGLSFGLTKPITPEFLAQEEKDHPAFAQAGAVVGGLGSLLEAGAAVRVAKVGIGAAAAGRAAVQAGLTAGERFIPRAIMTGATFGTRTFIADTVKAFQDGGVDLANFGKDVLKDTAFGSIFGTIGGLSSATASISSAGALGFLSSKMDGADNREASLNAAIWAAFETVGSVGKNEELRMEALRNLKESIGEYANARNPDLDPKAARNAASAFVDNAIRKAGFENAEDIAKSGPENLLEGIEKVNQAVRNAKIPHPGTTAEPLPKLPAPVEPEPTPEGAAPQPPTPAAPTTPVAKAIDYVKSLLGIKAESPYKGELGLPEGMSQTSPLAVGGNDRWTPDTGAQIGEPTHYLDIPKGGGVEDARAAITEHQTDQGESFYQINDRNGDQIGGNFANLKDAQEYAETRFLSKPTYEEKIDNLKKQGHDIAKIPQEAFPEDLKDVYHYEQGKTERADMSKSLSEISDRLKVLGVSPEEKEAIFGKYQLAATDTLGQPRPPSDFVNAPIEDQYKEAYEALAEKREIATGEGERIDAKTMEDAETAVNLINGYFSPKSQELFEFAKQYPKESDYSIAQMAYHRGLLEEPNPDLLRLEIKKAKQEKIISPQTVVSGMQIPPEDSIQPNQGLSPTEQGLPSQAGTGAQNLPSQSNVFPRPSDPSIASVTGHPLYVKITKTAEDIVNRYAKERGIEATPEFSQKLLNELHDVLGDLRTAPAAEKQTVYERIQKQYPNLQHDFTSLFNKIQLDKDAEVFEWHLEKEGLPPLEAKNKPLEIVKPSEEALNAKGKPFALFVGNQEGVGAMYNVYGEHPTLSTGRYMHSTVSAETIAKEGIPVAGREARVPEGVVPNTMKTEGMSTSGATMPRPSIIKEPKLPEPPVAEVVASALKESADEIKNIVNPSNAAPLAAQITRENLAKMARSYDKAEASLAEAKKFFDSQPKEANLDFIDKIERGEDLGNRNVLGIKGGNVQTLNEIAGQLRNLLDTKRKEIQDLGTGKMKSFIENYFPHIWDQGEKQVSQAVMKAAKRPFEGSKSFLKKRSIEFTKDGIEIGLTPVSYNPVDLALIKIREMDKYLMAHRTLKEYKENGLAKYVRVGEDAPEGFIKIDDRISTVFKSPMVPIKEAYDAKIMKALTDVAKNLGINLERSTHTPKGHGLKVGDLWGLSKSDAMRAGAPGQIWTRFAGPESAMAHELGHQLDHMYGLQNKFLSNDAINKELTELAKERIPEGGKTSKSFQEYIQKPEEKMAVMLESYIHAPDLLQEKAPKTYKALETFLKDNPKLEPLTQVEPSLVMAVNKSEVYAGGHVIAGNIYAQADAARIINNYLSPGLQKSSTYRAFRYAGNLLSQFQLGFSAFHLGFTSLDASVSKFALALNELASGHPLKAVRATLETPFAPISNIIRGNGLLKAWRAGGQDSSDEALAQAMVAAGGRARMDQFYATAAYDQMKHHFEAGNYIRGILHIPLSIAELSSKPILEWIVPRQKLGVFADMMKMEMENHPNMTHEQMREIAQKAWDSVDNRMGQLVYDNLFWNRTFKDLLMASVRSVGWNLGTIREMAGGAADYAEFISNAARGKKSEFSYRMAYFASLPIVVGILGAMTQYLRTGKGPSDLKDYYFPKTGGVDSHGDPSRVALPSYMKDLYHYTQHPITTITNKLNPVISIMAQMMNNKDYYGTKIRNEDDPLIKQVLSEAGFIAKQMTPFSIRNMQKNLETENKSLLDTIGPWVGLTPAPYDINQSKAETLAREIAATHQPIGGRTEEQADRSKLIGDLTRQYKRGDPGAVDNLFKAYQTGLISHRQMQNVIVHSSMTPLQRLVSNFTLEETERVYAKASDEEKAQIERMLQHKMATKRREFASQESMP